MNEITFKQINKAAMGDQDAIAELYEFTYNSVYKTVKSMIADEDTVLDIVQDSFIKGFQSLDQLDSAENFRAWMKRIAANKAKDYLKKKKPVLFTDMETEDGEEITIQDDCLDHCPEEVLDRKETARLMQEILSTLSEDQRLVIGMFYYEEMSVREIAESLECSENTVKSRLNYGRKKIEIKVKELEKKGTKLYSLAPIPFLLWLFRMDAEASVLPSMPILKAVKANCTASGGAAVSATAASTGAKAAASVGTKAVTTKIIAGVLAAAVIGGGAMAVTNVNKNKKVELEQQTVVEESVEQTETTEPAEQEITEVVPTEPAVTEEPAVVVAPEEVYQEILADYQAVLGVDSTAYQNNPESYFNGDHVIIKYYHMYHDGNFYYAYYDVDKNGTPELLIGAGSQDYINIVDLYGFDGTQVVQLIDEPTLGDRSHLTLYTDGTLYLFGASSATEATHEYFYVDGVGLKEAPPAMSEEESNIPWNVLEISAAPAVTNSLETILADIQEALMISTEEYDSDTAYYDSLYAHLGPGIMWELMHRETEAYTMAIWSWYLDLDGDGLEELLIGRGGGPGNVNLIRVYKQNGEIIYGDAVYAFTDQLYASEAPLNWSYIGG